MRRFLYGTRYDFLRMWKPMVAISATFLIAGLAVAAIRGIPLSTEFTGGTMVHLEFKQPPSAADVRSVVQQAGYANAQVQEFGSPTEYTVKAQPRGEASGEEITAREIEQALVARYGTGVNVVRTEVVGPRVGSELRRNAIIALLVSFLVTMVYLAIRFEWRFGIAAVAATAHDVITTIAFIAMMRIEVSLTVVAAVLTVIGYSLNDTIVIFDRVRENLRKQRKESMYEVLNRSINETLPRSVLTHLTTVASTVGLLVFAGEVIRPFAWVMFFGVWTGTFSSLYIANTLLLLIERKWPRRSGESKGTARALAADRQRQRPERSKGAVAAR